MPLSLTEPETWVALSAVGSALGTIMYKVIKQHFEVAQLSELAAAAEEDRKLFSEKLNEQCLATNTTLAAIEADLEHIKRHIEGCAFNQRRTAQ